MHFHNKSSQKYTKHIQSIMSKIRNITTEQLENKDEYNKLFEEEVNSEVFDYVRKKYQENNMDFTEDIEAYWIYIIYKFKMTSTEDVDKRWEHTVNEISYYQYLSDASIKLHQLGCKHWSRLVIGVILNKRTHPKSFLRAFCEMKKIEENRHYPNFGYTKNIADILSSRMSNMESKEGGFGLDKKTFISREDKFFWREFKNMKSHYGII
jgi:hypothetical protein